MANLYDKVISSFDTLRNEALNHKTLWERASKVVAIQLDLNYLENGNTVPDKQDDEFLNDPTAAVTNMQFGDALAGMMWHKGDVIRLKPSEYVEQQSSNLTSLNKWFEFATSRVLYHINNSDAGFISALRNYCYEQGGNRNKWHRCIY